MIRHTWSSSAATTSRLLAASLVMGVLGLGLALPASAANLPPAEQVLEKYAQAIGE
jgi:hypothetical protein